MNRLQHALRHAIDAQLNVVTAGNAVAAGQHFLFLMGQLAVAAAGLTALTIWLAVDPPSTPLAALVLLSILAPLATAVFVLRTGRLRHGQMTATLSLAGLAVWLCAVSGGLGSPFAFLFAIVPLASLLSPTPNALKRATVVSVAGLGLCVSISILGLNGALIDWQETAQFGLLVLLLIGLAAALAARLAVRVNTPVEVPSAVSLGDSGDLVTWHNRHGDIASASGLARELLGVRPEQLIGRGMANLVHIKDRSRFDSALQSASDDAAVVRLAYRIRAESFNPPGDIWVESTFRRVHAAGGAVSIVGVTRDVSRWRQGGPKDIQVSGSDSDPQFDTDLQASVDAIISLSGRLADPRLVVSREEHRGYARLIQTTGRQLAAMLGSDKGSGMDTNTDPRSAGSGIVATVQSAIDRALPRDMRCIMESTPDSGSAHVAVPQNDCFRTLVDVLQVARNNLSSEDGLIVTVSLSEASVRLNIGTPNAQPFVQRGPAYLGRDSVAKLGLEKPAAAVANWGGKLTIDTDAPNRSSITLILPVAASQQGSRGDLDWQGSVEVQKSA